jgi:IS30 family transposase
MGTFSYTLKCKLQPLNCLTLIGTEGTELNDVARLMNQRPRKTLGWKTPEEAMAE